MKLKKLAIVSYEPAVVTLNLRGASLERSAIIGKLAKEWLQKRKTKACGCKFRFCEIKPGKLGVSLEIQTEWACDDCLESLVTHLAKKDPEIVSAELGHAVPAQKKKGHDFIDVPARRVQLESGTWHSVPRFRISKEAVTIGQFESFAQATGYRTVAERDNDGETFRDNQTVSGFSPRAKWNASAVYLTQEDAMAYCKHYGYRLPTEVEWLSAAVADWVETNLTPDQLSQLSYEPLSDHLIEVHWREWVTSVNKDESFVTRNGPVRYLRKGWNSPDSVSRHRWIYPTDVYRITTGFRVVSEIKSDALPVSLETKAARKTVKRAKVSRSQ